MASVPAPMRRGALLALAAAATFGLSAPLIERFGRHTSALLTGALLYAGAALASLGRRSHSEAPVRREHVPRLVVVAVVGATIAPALLAFGVRATGPLTSSLLLNFEALFTAALAWAIHREHVSRRFAVALLLMLVGGGLLVLGAGSTELLQLGLGALAVVGATFAWALDNTLTRPLADLDPRAVVLCKAALGASAGFALGLALGHPLPPAGDAAGLVVCGAVSYGLSLRLYLLAQRRIGAGRTGSLFALAPFIGAAASWALGDRHMGAAAIAGAVAFAAAAYLHVTERHEHEHEHDEIEHEHAHSHDDGHHEDHAHDPPMQGEHSHPHRHRQRRHAHAHGEDAHHRHRH